MITYPYIDAPMDLRYDAHASQVLGEDYWRVLNTSRLMLSARQWASLQAGELIDKGSVPRIAWPLVPRDGKFEQAYGFHDKLCEYLSLTVAGRPFPITRERADQLLYVAMEVLGGTPEEIAPVRAAVEANRIVLRVDKPSNTALKRSLEAGWLL